MKIIDFEFSDYYKNGSITCEYQGVEYTFGAGCIAESQDEIRTIRGYTCFIEDECHGWSESRGKHFVILGDTDSVEWLDEYSSDPVDNEDIEFFDTEEQYKQWIITNYLQESEAVDEALLELILAVTARERDELANKLKYGGATQVMQAGFLSRLYDHCAPNGYTYEDLISERSGEDIEKVVAVWSRWAIERRADGRFVLWYVGNEEAEPYSTYDLYETAVVRIHQEVTA